MRKEEKQNHSRMTGRMIKRMSAGTLAAMITCTSLTGCSVSEKFADKIPFLKEEESTEPRYLVDTEYKQKMDEFVSVAFIRPVKTGEVHAEENGIWQCCRDDTARAHAPVHHGPSEQIIHVKGVGISCRVFGE